MAPVGHWYLNLDVSGWEFVRECVESCFEVLRLRSNGFFAEAVCRRREEQGQASEEKLLRADRQCKGYKTRNT